MCLISTSVGRCKPAMAGILLRFVETRIFFDNFREGWITNPLYARSRGEWHRLQPVGVGPGEARCPSNRTPQAEACATYDFANAAPTFMFRKRAGDAPWPVPMVCCGWPLPQLGVPHSVQCSREQMASQLFQNSVVIPL